MADLTSDPALAAKQAQDSELVALKQQMDRLKGRIAPGQNGQKKLREACNGFEAVFISKMWEQMRATIPKGGIMHSPQEDMYRSMFDKEFSEKLAADGGIGMADMLYNQLKDKIKDNTRPLGALDDRASVQAQAQQPSQAAAQGAAQSASQLERPGQFKAPKRPGGAALQTSDAGSAAAQGAAKTAPPASVPGGVMAEVETLARRIEAAYDARQTLAAGQGAERTGQA